MQAKICTKCGSIKDLSQFYVSKLENDGLQLSCKSCSSQYYQANKAKIAARGKIYRQTNKANIDAYRKVYNQENKVVIAAWHKAYNQSNKVDLAAKKNVYYQANKVAIAARQKTYKKNTEKRRVNKANYRARKIAAFGKHTASDIKALFTLQNGKCICCRTSLNDGYHVDHIYALINGGNNDKYNLQLLCPACNVQKNDKHPIDFMQSRGFLI